MSGDGSMSMNNCLRRAGNDLSGIKSGTSTGGSCGMTLVARGVLTDLIEFGGLGGRVSTRFGDKEIDRNQ